jgi:hypothetical protein
MKTAYFNRFSIDLPDAAVADCHHQGACDSDVAHWAGAEWQGATRIPRIARPDTLTPEILAAELKEYGAWDAEELADDDANWQRIIWLAAGNIQEEERA